MSSLIIRRHKIRVTSLEAFFDLFNAYYVTVSVVCTIVNIAIGLCVLIVFMARCRGALIRNALRAKRERGERHAAMMAISEESERGSSPSSTNTVADDIDDPGLARCRGALIRNALRAKRERGERHAAMMAISEESERGSSPSSTNTVADDIDDPGLVEQMFGFLPIEQQPAVLTDRKFAEMQSDARIDTIPIPLNRPLLPDTFENEDLRGYQFGKFAATYFQGQATAEYIKRPLRISLLPHNDATGQLASLAVWITILRFMGDLPDPKCAPSTLNTLHEKTSIMGKIYASLGRSYTKKDVELASQLGDYEQVS
uniref:MyTH4 domain-containing protein n=1 Tax=Ascaris lumbricoides TaxID=6252 RepID=A0A0M3IUM4_ASCLU